MRSARTEFIEHIEAREIKAAKIKFGSEWSDEENQIIFILPENYTFEQYEEFLKNIDRRYDSGYGGQELFGNIWYEDGTWSERGEYDGSEWWNYMKCPEIDF